MEAVKTKQTKQPNQAGQGKQSKQCGRCGKLVGANVPGCEIKGVTDVGTWVNCPCGSTALIRGDKTRSAAARTQTKKGATT